MKLHASRQIRMALSVGGQAVPFLPPSFLYPNGGRGASRVCVSRQQLVPVLFHDAVQAFLGDRDRGGQISEN